MTVTQDQIDDVDHRFAHHAPGSDDVVRAHEGIRGVLAGAARYVIHSTKKSREQSLALTALEEAMFWANAAVARHHADNRHAAGPDDREDRS